MKTKTLSLFFLSFVIVAFGQPAWSGLLSFLASFVGFALFFRVLIEIPEKKKRFITGTFWYAGVQLVQSSWFLSHPFYYIIAPYILLALLWGVQFGVVSLFIEREKIIDWRRILVVCAVWTLMEWSRLFILSGYAFNPIGLSLAANTLSLQSASLFGVYGMSFLVMLVNLLFLRVWIKGPAFGGVAVLFLIAVFPYLYGAVQVKKHSSLIDKSSRLNALLVQTAFPIEETLCFSSHQELLEYVMGEWKQVVQLVAEKRQHSVELIALPEFVVPFGTYSFVYPFEKIYQIFEEAFGKEEMEKLPPMELPFAVMDDGEWKVSNAYLSQALANILHSGLVVGLEDAEDFGGRRHYYSGALYFQPLAEHSFEHKRYAKRVLVPMGEYIPFSFCREMAANYGVFGSFTPGEEAVVWRCGQVDFGVSICYEETFGEMMRENRISGASMLLNLTSDAWFPYSKLIRQHLEHSRLRTVENGIPLLRSCNTGVTGCVDALGRDVALLGDNDSEREDLSEAFFVQAPTYHFRTLYSRFGDGFIVGLSLLMVFLFFRFK